MAYCTASDIKSRLDITTSAYDPKLTEFAEAVSEWIDIECKLPLGAFEVAADSTRYFGLESISNVDGQVLRLDAPLLSITSMTNGDGSALDAAAYRLHPRNEDVKWSIHLLSGYSWSFDTDGEVVIEGKWGRSLFAPMPIREAAMLFAGWIFKRYQAALQDAKIGRAHV